MAMQRSSVWIEELSILMLFGTIRTIRGRLRISLRDIGASREVGAGGAALAAALADNPVLTRLLATAQGPNMGYTGLKGLVLLVNTLREAVMKRIAVVMALALCSAIPAEAGLLDKIKEAVPEAAKQQIQEPSKELSPQPMKQEVVTPAAAGIQTEAPKPAVAAAPASGLSPDQQDANACSAYTHEDYKKVEQALRDTKLVRGSSRYLAKNEWVDLLKARYPNMKREKDDFYIHFGKWFGKSCAYVNLKCVPKEPGCDADMRCMDFYTQRGGRTCPPNLCSDNDAKCIAPYKPPAS